MIGRNRCLGQGLRLDAEPHPQQCAFATVKTSAVNQAEWTSGNAKPSTTTAT